jgi:hypothetical protein
MELSEGRMGQGWSVVRGRWDRDGADGRKDRAGMELGKGRMGQ